MNDLFIYCGHGAGEQICERHRLKKYNCPSAMLWGCSSGKLSALGVHDPSGAILSYVLGGAQWAVGNLWDVTDKDIDRLSMECMDAVFTPDRSTDTYNESISSVSSRISISSLSPSHTTSIASCLMQSRHVCKMKRLVGSAPVMYGLPARLTFPSNHRNHKKDMKKERE